MCIRDSASSYSPEGSTIAVIVRSDAKHVFIEVEDHGCGISEEDKKRVFDRFYRADKSRNCLLYTSFSSSQNPISRHNSISSSTSSILTARSPFCVLFLKV